MNATPIFTDSRGRKFKPIETTKPDHQWTPVRAVGAAMLVACLALVSFAAVTQIDLTAAGNQVRGILPMANGGTHSSSVSTGVARSDGTTITGAELSGDATTSGSNAVTVAR